MGEINRRKFVGAALGSAGLMTGAAGGAPVKEDTKVNVGTLGKTPQTKFAVNLEMWWRKLPFLDRVKKAAEFGYPAVEFWAWKNKDLDALAELTKQLGLVVAQFTDHPGRHEPGTGEIHYNRVLKQAHDLGYRGYVGLECKPKTSELAAAIAVARADVW